MSIGIIRPPIGIVAAGGFKRLPMHTGALYRLSQTGCKPAFAIGSSAGAVAMAACLPWTEQNFKKVNEAVINLKKSNIYTSWTQMKIIVGLHVAELALTLILREKINAAEEKSSLLLTKLAIELVRAGAPLGVEGAFLKRLFSLPSLYSPAPLRKFLRKQFDFNGIWHSAIQMEIPAVDIHTGTEFIFELNKERHRPDRNERLVEAILASASLPAHFPLVKLDGHYLDDAAILNSVPIHRAVLAGCETIFVLLYSNNGTATVGNSWIDELTRALDICINENTRKTLLWHSSINQDLAVSMEQERQVIELESDLKEVARGDLQDRMYQKLSNLKNNLKHYAFYGKRLTNIIPVMTDEHIPEQYFRKFDRDLMKQAMDIGYRAMDKTLANLT